MNQSMDSPISVFVCGIPVGQPRPRARRAGKRIIMYDPKTAHKWRETVAMVAGAAIKRQLEGPLDVSLVFFFPRPKSHYGTGKNSDVLKASAPTYHTQKPDIDNVCKSTLDAMNDVVYGDDKQVVKLLAEKRWAHQPGQAGLALRVVPLGLQEEESGHDHVEQYASESP